MNKVNLFQIKLFSQFSTTSYFSRKYYQNFARKILITAMFKHVTFNYEFLKKIVYFG